MIEKIMYLYRKYRDEIIFGKLLENLLDMKKPPKKSVVFILRRGHNREAGTKVRQKCQNTKYCGQEFF